MVVLILVVALALIAVGVVLHNRIIAELRAVKSEVQVMHFRTDASFERVHARLRAIGGTVSSDLRDATDRVKEI